MADFFCKYCGTKHSSVAGLTASNCNKNPNGGKHVPYEGSTTEKAYVCMYCGTKHSTIAGLTASNCNKNPEGRHHVPYRGSASQKEFVCMYCGTKNSTAQGLTASSCNKNPTANPLHRDDKTGSAAVCLSTRAGGAIFRQSRSSFFQESVA
jgi:DNA-directed RNA polymerase subunit RPC12/RpoP